MLLEMRTPVTIQTSLSRAEVIDRLTRSVEPPGPMFPFFGPLGLVGRTGPEHCWFENGSFFRKTNRRLTLRYQDALGGTILHGDFAFPTLQLIPIIAVIGVGTLMCLFFGIGIVKSLVAIGPPLNLWRFTPFAVLFTGLLMLKFTLGRLDGSERELVDLLHGILKGPAASTGEILIRPRH
jgi:hypothetical protein